MALGSVNSAKISTLCYNLISVQNTGERLAIKVFSGGPDFKSLKREIDVVRSLPPHENIVKLYGVEEDVSIVQHNIVFFVLVWLMFQLL